MHPGKKDDENCWYYSKSNDKSSSWTGAAEFKRYVTGGKSRIKYKNTNWSKVDKGDIIQEVSGGSAYHSMIVTGFVTSGAYNQRTDITVCSHTPNRKDVLVSKYYTDSKVYHSILGNK